MKQNKFIIPLAVVLILAMVSFMAYDFFGDSKNKEKNKYEYNLDDFTKVDSQLITYKEAQQITPDMENIKAVSVDEFDNIYVAGKDKIHIYDNNGKLTKDIITNVSPQCIASKDDKIFIGIGDHIEIWNSEGALTDRWKKTNDKSVLTSIAVTDSSVFVSDAGNKIVYCYNFEGELLNEIGRKDSTAGIQGFVIPSPYFDIAIGRDNELWAVSSGRHQFEAYTQDGRLISSWKKTSMNLDGFSGCCNPSHFAMLTDGSFVTTEKGIVRVKIHDASGKFKTVVAAPNQFDKDTKGLDVAVDSEGKIIVLDPKRNLVRIFIKK